MLLIDEIDRSDTRVRGLPARVPVGLPGDDSRAGHPAFEPSAAGGGAHLQPHARAARRAQAPLPLPLDPVPGRRARAPILRAHAPGLDEAAAGALVEAIQRVRAEKLLKRTGHRGDDRLGPGRPTRSSSEGAPWPDALIARSVCCSRNARTWRRVQARAELLGEPADRAGAALEPAAGEHLYASCARSTRPGWRRAHRSRPTSSGRCAPRRPGSRGPLLARARDASSVARPTSPPSMPLFDAFVSRRAPRAERAGRAAHRGRGRDRRAAQRRRRRAARARATRGLRPSRQPAGPATRRSTFPPTAAADREALREIGAAIPAALPTIARRAQPRRCDADAAWTSQACLRAANRTGGECCGSTWRAAPAAPAERAAA